ncbi:MAG: DUF6524 family protein, partial [Pyrinomonadaceae bacterium]
VLAVAFSAGLIWLMIEWQLFSARNLRTMTHLVLIIISAVLAVGMSWSHINRRLSGQVDTDEVLTSRKLRPPISMKMANCGRSTASFVTPQSDGCG